MVEPRFKPGLDQLQTHDTSTIYIFSSTYSLIIIQKSNVESAIREMSQASLALLKRAITLVIG